MGKNMHIETLRGIAILLVVMGHVIGSAPGGGMKIDFPHPLRYLYLWIDYIQMPLFTAIAGWVYAIKSCTDFVPFIKRKALRLLVPMIVVVTSYFLIQYFIPGTNCKGDIIQIWKLLIFPYSLYWYLPSLFLIFVIQSAIDKYKWMDKPSEWFIILLFSYACCFLEKYIIPVDVPNLFSFKGALNQLPYFITGIGIFRFMKSITYHSFMKFGCLLAAFVGVVLLQIEWFRDLTGCVWYEISQPLWVISTLVLLLYHAQWSISVFSWFGQYAYSIYLFHGFGTAGGRIILKYLGVSNIYILFVGILFLALISSIILEKLLVKYRWARLCLLGKL